MTCLPCLSEKRRIAFERFPTAKSLEHLSCLTGRDVSRIHDIHRKYQVWKEGPKDSHMTNLDQLIPIVYLIYRCLMMFVGRYMPPYMETTHTPTASH